MKNNDNKKISLTLIVLGLIISFFGGSLAYWNWETSEEQRTLVSVNVKGATLTIEGSNIEHTSMYPTNDCDGEAALIGEVATVTADNETASDMEVILRIRVRLSATVKPDNLTAEKKSKINWSMVEIGSGMNCNTTPYRGTFVDAENNKDIDIDTGIRFIATKKTTTSRNYQLYVWLDSAYEHTNVGDDVTDPMQNLNISVKYSPASELSQEFNPSPPELDPGMIPVTIANNGDVTTISPSNSSWYNYSDKQWANAVLVNESSRSNYLGTSGHEVNQDDILAYYVWIPRYKYKIWTLDVSSAGQEQTIDIVFESKNAQITEGSQVGDYITHPAFVWDGNTIAGIWVGKFEATGNATTQTILPNVSSLRSQNVSKQFATSLKFAGGTQSGSNVTFIGNNTYGLISSTDSHMMKNSEWGAVAYLSHSKYGINSEIRINNNNNYITGCGASEENGSSTSECQIEYGEATLYPQSTTGKITGIFDMSGCAHEYVMGNYGNISSYSGFTTFPESKYYDLYSITQFTGVNGTNMTLCTLETCGGHALYETAHWYSDVSFFVDSDNPWFSRSGFYVDSSGAGEFLVYYYDGYGYGVISWRSVLVVDGV